MMGLKPPEPDLSEFVEVDPTGRYGRYNDILGKGSSKTVYRAFDEFEGIEVAWNQVKLYDFLQSPEDLERLYCEIHLLKTLKHKNIMKFYTSWVDTANRNINFVTEMFTSGTLRQYRQKHKRVNIRAVKHWCRQILRGLLYLHGHDPPVIHRDLKCDNIFVNGNQGEVKIGDLGLAAILRKSHAAHCVGTPEFMAPEVYEEAYNELVDIYSFGMCLLEMVTFEYPYSECSHPAQIYKKVISGKKPEALYKVQDPEVRLFVEKCLATVSRRLPARELLKDPFLQIDDSGSDSRLLEFCHDPADISPLFRQPLLTEPIQNCSFVNESHNNFPHEDVNEWDYNVLEVEPTDHAVFSGHEDEYSTNMDISIKGKKRDDEDIFLRLRIADKEGRIRNIYFPFDIEADTALSVATEMVAELDITDQDVTKIAEMIDDEISALVPQWKPGPGIEETQHFQTECICHNCASNGSSNGSLLDYHSSDHQVLHCSRPWCAAMHGRFEEITYEVEGSEHCLTEGAPVVSSQSDGLRYTDIWAQQEGHDLSSQGSRGTHSDEEHNQSDQPILPNDRASIHISNQSDHQHLEIAKLGCPSPDDYENEIRQELRWLKAKYQVELRELSSQQFGSQKSSIMSPSFNRSKHEIENVTKDYSNLRLLQADNDFHCPMSLAFPIHPSPSSPIRKSVSNNKNSSNSSNGSNYPSCSPISQTQRARNCEAINECSPQHFYTAKSFYTGALLPYSLQRSQSLPVDAVDV